MNEYEKAVEIWKIDNETPSFAISLYEKYREKGIGIQLMKSMLKRNTAFINKKNNRYFY